MGLGTGIALLVVGGILAFGGTEPGELDGAEIDPGVRKRAAARTGQAGPPGLLGLAGAAGVPVQGAEMPMQVGTGGIDLELLSQQAKVAVVFMRLVAVVPDVVERQACGADSALASLNEALDVREKRFVHRTLETDAGIAPDQAVFAVGGVAGARAKADGGAEQLRIGEFGIEHGTLDRMRAFIRIDIEQPVARRVLDGMVTGGGKVIPPRKKNDTSPGIPCDLGARIR